MRVLIDPGHGGESLGTLQGFLPEKDLNLYVALKLADRLKGWEVYLTREDDSYLSLGDRLKVVERVRPDVFLSVHHNAYEEEVEDRSEVYTGWEIVSPSYDLAYMLYGELVERLPGRRWVPPLPSTYTVVKDGPDVRLLTELFFAREMDEGMLDLEVEVLHAALERFRRTPEVGSPDERWSYGTWTYLPGHRTTRYEGGPLRIGDGNRVVVLRDGRAFWYGLYLSRTLGARYLHTGMTLQEADLHIALRLTGHRGLTLILQYGEPEVGYYRTNREGRELAEYVGGVLGYPVRERSSYLLIHLYGPRILIRSRWNRETVEKLARALKGI